MLANDELTKERTSSLGSNAKFLTQSLVETTGTASSVYPKMRLLAFFTAVTAIMTMEVEVEEAERISMTFCAVHVLIDPCPGTSMIPYVVTT